MIYIVSRYGIKISAMCFAAHTPTAESAGTGGKAIIKNKLPKMINGKAETTPSRIARKCFCSDSFAIGVDKLFSKNEINLSICSSPFMINY
jgi:hypothetical protein